MPLHKAHWYYLPVNPVQWEVGPVSVGRKNGKYFPKVGRSENLHSFQEEVREYFEQEAEVDLLTGDIDVYFWFWQRLDQYRTPSGRTQTKSAADATNMQKATEDALQGILFGNDRDNRRVGSEIVAQGKDVQPGIVIKICNYVSNWEDELPGWILAMRDKAGSYLSEPSNNSWPPKEGL